PRGRRRARAELRQRPGDRPHRGDRRAEHRARHHRPGRPGGDGSRGAGHGCADAESVRMAVVGLGMDLCSVERIARVLAGPNGERFRERVYTEAEAATCEGRGDAATAYAARFAAKEALVKALGAPPGIRWRDMEVVKAPSGAPAFV